jgi:hypothetical protein
VIRIAMDNPTRGTGDFPANSSGSGHPIAASTVWQICMPPGSIPRLAARATWKQFLTAQAQGILAADFVHVPCCSGGSCPDVIEHGTASSSGYAAHPNGAWTPELPATS